MMEQVLCEPFELTESELDAVAGGNPFNVNNVLGTNNAFGGAHFAIGAVLGDFSTASGLFVGRLNTLGFINIDPTASIVVNNNVSIL